MCKKQTSVSHSSTESAMISLDAGSRMDGLPALDLWDIVIQLLRSPQTNKKLSIAASGNGSVTTASGNRTSEIPKVHQSNKNQKEHPAAGNGNVRSVDQLSQMGHVTSKIQSSQGDSKLYIFEDNEAVINMLMKERSPTMRHVT